MAIIKWGDPMSLMAPNFWPSSWFDEDYWPEERSGLSVYETDNDVIAKANVPGVPAGEVEVSFEAGVLTVKAEHKETEEEKKKKKTVYRQSRQARYYYSASIPNRIKVEKIAAQVADGVVTVTMPKAEEAKPKKITVKAVEK